MILSDEEILSAVRGFYGTPEGAFMGSLDDIQTARAIEAAILSKLASAELPEPIQRDDTEHGVDYYTAAQLQQAYAQGAAAQLSSEPVAARVWVGSYEGADHENQYVYSEDGDGEPLYTRREA